MRVPSQLMMGTPAVYRVAYWGLLFSSLPWPASVAQFTDDQIPQCASTCVSGAFYSPDCQDKDYQCLCNDPTMLTFLVPCTCAICESPDIDLTIYLVQDLCAKFGVTFSAATISSLAQPFATKTSISEPSSHLATSAAANPSQAKPISVSVPQSSLSSETALGTPSDTSTATAVAGTEAGSKLSAAAIAGISVGFSTAVILIGVLMYLLFRRRRCRKLGGSALVIDKYPESNNWGGIGPDNDAPGVLVQSQ
ncbi:hypothetical protein TWF718_009864 [Orbilia javanica]|uniref:CFEM domain-containing protein n=1 Tax=Orbilia javanica TaxID=47235 RepID=A0AAN8RLQ8_9PEZI